MIVSSKQCIGPVPVLEMRRCLHFFVDSPFNATDIHNYLRISIANAQAALCALREEGFVADLSNQDVTTSGDVHVVLTDKGKELRRCTAAKPVFRKTADRLLREFMTRVAEINASDEYLMSVARVVIFGSYLTDRDPIGDLDIAVYLEKRWESGMGSDRYNELIYGHFEKSGRTIKRITDPQVWPSEQVNLCLKNRTRTISIQPWGSFLTMPKSPNFQYRVLLGDSEQIARELSTAEAESTVRDPRKFVPVQR
jgi:DNA-binding MarR family transcriptional regulator